MFICIHPMWCLLLTFLLLAKVYDVVVTAVNVTFSQWVQLAIKVRIDNFVKLHVVVIINIIY